MRELPLRSALPAVAAVLGVLVALPAPAHAATTPTGYSVTTAGAAVRVLSTQQPAFSIATGDVVDQTLSLVSSSFASSTSEARAASYYPGDLLAQAGQLICGQFGPCPVEPPTYPLLAEASWPTVQRSTVDPAGLGAGTATASASSTGNAASTAAAGGASGGLVVGGATSTTSTMARDDGMHVQVATVLHDVSMGPLGIASLRVTDDVLVRPDGRTRSVPHVAAAGVTVAGTPVELGSTPLPALAEQGLAVRLVGTEAAGARSGATGVRIDVSVPVQGVGAPVPGLPSLDRTYVGSVVLGQVAVLAARDDTFRLPTLPLPGGPAASGPAGQLPVDGLPPATTGQVSGPAAPVAGPARPGGWLVLRSFRLEDLDLSELYALLATGALSALVVSRVLTRRAWA
ncbi:MAG: hypothetical protein ABR549_15180 [Mycobacteriales bacterium]